MSLLPLPSVIQSAGTPYRSLNAAFNSNPFESGYRPSSSMASAIARFADAGMPSGFSFDASFTMVVSSRPNSRATSEIGRPAM